MDYENNWFLLKEFLEAALVSMVQKMSDGEVRKIKEDEVFAKTSDSLCKAFGVVWGAMDILSKNKINDLEDLYHRINAICDNDAFVIDLRD